MSYLKITPFDYIRWVDKIPNTIFLQTIKIATPLSLKPPTSKPKKPGNRQRSKSLDNIMSDDVTPLPFANYAPKKSTLSPGAQVEKRRSLPEVIKKESGSFLPELVVTCPDED